jgi:hypothetical protein
MFALIIGGIYFQRTTEPLGFNDRLVRANSLIEASLSKPRTSELALHFCLSVCPYGMYVVLKVAALL